MSSDIYAQAGYLILLGLFLAIGLWTRARENIGQTLQHAMIWGLIFLATLVGFGLWGDVKRHLRPQQISTHDTTRVEVPISRDGHYYLRLHINNQPIDFVIDTGASDIVLTKDDAQRVGIRLDKLNFSGRAATANGAVKTAPVRLETVNVGDIQDRDVYAVVNDGELFASLLGMGYLQRWGRIEIANNTLSLIRE